MSNELDDKPEVEEGAPKWIVTFGDLMSLLLCFFVLLLSFSETDKAFYKEVAGSMSEAFGVQRDIKTLDSPMGQSIISKDFEYNRIVPTISKEEAILERLKKEINKELEGEGGVKDLIKIETGKNKISIKLMGESTFDSGKADIKPKMKAVLKKIASILKATNGNITIAGHTDNIPVIRGQYKSNLVLSMARASAVAELMIKKNKINPERISAMGYGKYRPHASNLTREGRQKNRRVEIILHTSTSNMPDMQPYKPKETKQPGPRIIAN